MYQIYSYKIYACVYAYIYVKRERQLKTIKSPFELIQSGNVQDAKSAYRISILLAIVK